MVMHTYCEICGKRINYSGKGRPPKYCKECFKAQYKSIWWQKNKDRYRDRVKARLGTSDFEPHIIRKQDGMPDWEKEYKEIQDEIKRIGLRIKR